MQMKIGSMTKANAAIHGLNLAGFKRVFGAALGIIL
jgi:hypothetical protein